MQIEELIEFIQKKIIRADAPVVGEDSKLFEDDIIDSLSILHLVGYIEKSLGRKLQDDELVFKDFSTPAMIVNRYGKA